MTRWRAHVRAKVMGVRPEETAQQEAVREKLADEHDSSNAWIVFKSSPSTEGLVAPEKERFGRMVGQVCIFSRSTCAVAALCGHPA